jgi:hypothetical protein
MDIRIKALRHRGGWLSGWVDVALWNIHELAQNDEYTNVGYKDKKKPPMHCLCAFRKAKEKREEKKM